MDVLASCANGQPLAVQLNVYDVEQADGRGAVVRLNSALGPRGLGLGGVFHGAIVLGSVEFSFGFCEHGTGVYAVKAGANPMYTYRETVQLGVTPKSLEEIRGIISQLKAEWQGSAYDLLNRNCCHFCEDMAARLQVAPVPGWLNRLASGAAATVSMTQETVRTMSELGAEMKSLFHKTLAAASQTQQQLTARLAQPQQQPLQQPQQQGTTVSRDGSSHSSSPVRSGGSALAAMALTGLSQAGRQLKATTSRLAEAAASRVPSSIAPATVPIAPSNGSGGAIGALLPGAQPKLSRELRLSDDPFLGEDGAEDDAAQVAAVAAAVHHQHERPCATAAAPVS